MVNIARLLAFNLQAKNGDYIKGFDYNNGAKGASGGANAAGGQDQMRHISGLFKSLGMGNVGDSLAKAFGGQNGQGNFANQILGGGAAAGAAAGAGGASAAAAAADGGNGSAAAAAAASSSSWQNSSGYQYSWHTDSNGKTTSNFDSWGSGSGQSSSSGSGSASSSGGSGPGGVDNNA